MPPKEQPTRKLSGTRTALSLKESGKQRSAHRRS